MIRRPLKIAFLFFLLAIPWLQNCSYGEVRAMWITRYQIDSKPKIDRFIKDASDNGFNTLVVQVLGRGVAYYDSSLIPKYEFGFDPLAYTVEKSHNTGLKVIAWLNTYYVWSSPEAPSFRDHVVNLHPDWVISEGNMKYLNPALPPVRDYLYAVYAEVASKYKVDGIHFDYVRYPNAYSGMDYGSRRTFSNSYWLDPVLLFNDPSAVKQYYGNIGFRKLRDRWSDYRSSQVTGLLERIYKGIKAINSSIEVSAAVLADSDSAKRENGQDWILWVKKGIIDKIYPMAYTEDLTRFNKLVRRAAAGTRKPVVVVGFGAYKNTPQELIKQIKLYRYYGYRFQSLAGICLFSYDSIASDREYLPVINRNAF